MICSVNSNEVIHIDQHGTHHLAVVNLVEELLVKGVLLIRQRLEPFDHLSVPGHRGVCKPVDVSLEISARSGSKWPSATMRHLALMSPMPKLLSL